MLKRVFLLMSMFVVFSSTLCSQSYNLDAFVEAYKTRYPEYSERIDKVVAFLKQNVNIKSGDRLWYQTRAQSGSFLSTQLEGFGSLSISTSPLERHPIITDGIILIKVIQPVYSYSASLLSASNNWHLYGAFMNLEKENGMRFTDIFNFSNSINIKDRFFNDFSILKDEYKTFPGNLFVFVPLNINQQEILEDILFETIPKDKLLELLENERFQKIYSDYEKRREAKNYLAVRLGIAGKPSTHVLIDELLNKVNEEISDGGLPKDLIQTFFTDQVISLMEQSGNGDAVYLKKIASQMKDINLIQGQQGQRSLFNVKLGEMKQEIFKRNALKVK